MPGLPRAGEEPRRNHPGKPPALLPEAPPHPSRRQPGNLYICEVPLTIALSFSEQHEAGKSSSHGEHVASSEFCTRLRWRRETAPEPGLQSNPVSSQQALAPWKLSHRVGGLPALRPSRPTAKSSPLAIQGLATWSVQERQTWRGAYVAPSTWGIFQKSEYGLNPWKCCSRNRLPLACI